MADMFTVLFPSTAAQLNRIETMLGELMASFEEAKQAWVDYANDLKSQNDALRAALTDAQQQATDAAAALQQFQDDDAATDAQQLANQAQQFADQLTTALDSVKEPPVEPEPLPDPGNPSQAPDDGSGDPQVNPLA